MWQDIRFKVKYLVGEALSFCRETTIHGFSHIGNQNHITTKVFWALIIVGGFGITKHLFMGSTRDWEENPFITTIRLENLLGSDIPFPTATVCPRPFALPDQWALVRRIANNVKFECYEGREGFPPCEETEKTRNSVTASKCKSDVFRLFREFTYNTHCNEHINTLSYALLPNYNTVTRKHTTTQHILESMKLEFANRKTRIKLEHCSLPVYVTVPEDLSGVSDLPEYCTTAGSSEPPEYPEAPYVIPVMGRSKDEVVEKGFEMFGKLDQPWRLYGEFDGGGNASAMIAGSCDPEVQMNYTKAIKIYGKIKEMIPDGGHDTPFGEFIHDYYTTNQRAKFGNSFTRQNTPWTRFYTLDLKCAGQLDEADTALHEYLESLTAAIGIDGERKISLYELPVILSPKHPDRYIENFFPHTLCRDNSSAEFSLLTQTNYWTHPDPRHPCDREDVAWNCDYWSDAIGRENLYAVIRVMKVAHHLGTWDRYKIDTDEFPTLDNEAERDEMSDLLIPFAAAYWDKKHGNGSRIFEPVVTDQGICLAANAVEARRIFRKGHEFRKTFESAFAEDIIDDHDEVKTIKGESATKFYQLLFHIDGKLLQNDRVQGHESDLQLDQLDLTLNWNGDIFDFRANSISIRKGHLTTVRVINLVKSSVSEGVEKMPIEERGCRLPHETEGMELFEYYTQAGCKFECKLKETAQKCRCIPWNYPNPIANVSTICDLFGAMCFELTMNRTDMDLCNGCEKNCHEIKFDYLIQEEEIQDPDLFMVSIQLASGTYTSNLKSLKATFEDKVAMLGGTLGLFTGTSILSVIEAVYFAVVVFFKSLRGGGADNNKKWGKRIKALNAAKARKGV